MSKNSDNTDQSDSQNVNFLNYSEQYNSEYDYMTTIILQW